jgi:hypothetical protein
MSTKIVTAALVAAFFSSFVAAFSASAQSYGGGPSCAYGENWDSHTYRCVPNSALRPRR